MKLLSEIIFKPFEKKYQKETKSLILAGLLEHWGKLDPNKNTDLDNIDVSYSNSFFLAWHKNKIVGTGALVPRSNEIIEIVRMSVEKMVRRKGIGKMILQKLVEEARSRGFKQVILETTHTWQEVIAFYKDFGFEISHYQDDNIYFSLNL